MFKYVSFRSALALILSLFISTAIGRRIIDKLQMLQIGETVRNLGLEGQMSKKGTPTMEVSSLSLRLWCRPCFVRS